MRKSAKEVLDEVKITEIPVDISKIAAHYGFSVFQIPMDYDISGMIIASEEKIQEYDAKKIIIVNREHSKLRNRFTIAHELGHYFLRGEPQKCFAHRNMTNVNNMEERQANSFASELLMPKEAVERVIKELEEDGVPMWHWSGFISNRFKVSGRAAEVRLNKLGYIF